MGSGLAVGWSVVGSKGERSFSGFLLRVIGVDMSGVGVGAGWIGLAGVVLMGVEWLDLLGEFVTVGLVGVLLFLAGVEGVDLIGVLFVVVSLGEGAALSCAFLVGVFSRAGLVDVEVSGTEWKLLVGEDVVWKFGVFLFL